MTQRAATKTRSWSGFPMDPGQWCGNHFKACIMNDITSPMQHEWYHHIWLIYEIITQIEYNIHSIDLFDIFIMWGSDTFLIWIFWVSSTQLKITQGKYTLIHHVGYSLNWLRFLINYSHKLNLNIRDLTHEACEEATWTRSGSGFSPDLGQLCDNH